MVSPALYHGRRGKFEKIPNHPLTTVGQAWYDFFMAVLNAQFYNRDTLTVAQELLGKYFVRNHEGEFAICKITETEAYVGRVDRACHAFGYRKTERTQTLFMAPGHAYIYLIYGMYHCFNFVTEPEGEPSAVLLRGLSSCYGADWMSRNRYGISPAELSAYQKKNFLNGPGKVCKALNMTRELNAVFCASADAPFYVVDRLSDLGLPDEDAAYEVNSATRIGVDYAGEDARLPWRYFIDSPNIFR